MMTTVVVATVACDEMHLTETLVVGPVLRNGEVEGCVSSSADFCDVCDSPAMVIGLTATEREVEDEMVSCYELKSVV